MIVKVIDPLEYIRSTDEERKYYDSVMQLAGLRAKDVTQLTFHNDHVVITVLEHDDNGRILVKNDEVQMRVVVGQLP